MTNIEITDWIQKHIAINDRLNEVYDKLDNLETTIKALNTKYGFQRKSVNSIKETLFQITRLCMKSKNPEKTLETIFSLASNVHKKITKEID